MVTEYTNVLRKYAAFDGRAGRSEFWWFAFAQGIICVAAGILSSAIHDWIFSIWFFYFLGTLLPSLAVCVRRLHDVGRSAWWLLVGAAPTLIALPLAMLGVYLIAVGIAGGILGGLFAGIVEVISGGGGSADSTVEVFEGFFLMGLALTGVGAIGMIAGAVFAIILIVYLASPGDMGYNKYGPQPMLWQGKG